MNDNVFNYQFLYQKKKIEKDTQQGLVFSPDLSKLYGELILRKLQVLPGFITDEQNCNVIRYSDDTMLKQTGKIGNKSEKKGLSIVRKKNVCLLTKWIPKCERRIRNTKIKYV